MAGVDTFRAENSTEAVTTSRSWLVMAAALLGWVWGLNAAQGAEAVSKAERVNVRSRAGYAGEVMTQVKKGQSVSVLDTVTLRRPAADEPPVWLKIELPPGSPVWVNDEFVDAKTGVVKADMLNLRSGPTYDHAIVHRVKRGFQLSISEPAKDGWLKVSAPRGAAGFVPASLFTLGSPLAASSSNAVAVASAPSPAAKPSSNAPPVVPAVPTSPKATPADGVAPASTSVPVPGKAAAQPTAAEAQKAQAPSPAEASQNPVSTPKTVASAPAQVTAVGSAPTTSPSPTTQTARSGSGATSANNAWLEQFVRKSSVAAPGGTNTVAATEPVAEVVPTSMAAASEANADPTPPVRSSRRSGRKEREASTVVEASSAESSEKAAESAPNVPVEPEMQPGRWVRREGLLVWPKNIVAPSHYALKTRDGGRVINFVIITQPGVPSLREYRGRVVILSGREYLDKRPVWRNIPLLDVETIEAVR